MTGGYKNVKGYRVQERDLFSGGTEFSTRINELKLKKGGTGGFS